MFVPTHSGTCEGCPRIACYLSINCIDCCTQDLFKLLYSCVAVSIERKNKHYKLIPIKVYIVSILNLQTFTTYEIPKLSPNSKKQS